MDKPEILAAIRRVAAENKGRPPGSQKLHREIGLRKVDWYPKLWLRWSDAIREAGLPPNALSTRFDTDYLLQKYVDLIRELGRFPIDGELIRKRRTDDSFPSRDALSKLGGRTERAAKVAAYCRRRSGFEDVIAIADAAASTPDVDETKGHAGERAGYVYMVKHGARAEYKVGFTHNVMRREGEIRLELPDVLRPVHFIETDDPAGVEAYWHRRFADKRLRNEWFALKSADVRAFRRWKRIF